MGYRSFVALMLASSVLAWVVLGYVINSMNPFEAGITGFVAFYLSLFLALVGTLSVLGVLFRVQLRKRHQTAFREVRIAFRHALLLGAFSVICLALSANGWLAWWNFLVLLGLVGLIEYLSLLVQEGRRS
ncbi:hypothetical protein IT407_00660 [Candidatus Uhrbacteria bacterium]|nr:hypothetical protein [Candidatus Uhrbacteria bacterium]